MALSPTIPTSFVPKQPVAPNSRPVRSKGNNIVFIVSVIILVGSLVAALGVFLYSNYLKSVEKNKELQLVTDENSITEATVDQFIELRDRLTSSNAILSKHIAMSQFFTTLEAITLKDVHFDSLSVEVADDRSATINLKGEAQNFNALAAESQSFAGQKLIKSAIFSNITVNKDNSVGFTVDANLDPTLVIQSTSPAPQSNIVQPATQPTVQSAAIPSVRTATAPTTASAATSSAATSATGAANTTP